MVSGRPKKMDKLSFESQQKVIKLNMEGIGYHEIARQLKEDGEDIHYSCIATFLRSKDVKSMRDKIYDEMKDRIITQISLPKRMADTAALIDRMIIKHDKAEKRHWVKLNLELMSLVSKYEERININKRGGKAPPKIQQFINTLVQGEKQVIVNKEKEKEVETVEVSN